MLALTIGGQILMIDERNEDLYIYETLPTTIGSENLELCLIHFVDNQSSNPVPLDLQVRGEATSDFTQLTLSNDDSTVDLDHVLQR